MEFRWVPVEEVLTWQCGEVFYTAKGARPVNWETIFTHKPKHHNYQELRRSLRVIGFRIPLVAVRKPDGDIVTEDGHRRFVAAVDLGYKFIPFYIVEDDREADVQSVQVVRTRCYAIGIERLLELMRAAGFTDVQRLDCDFYQPVLVGTRPPAPALHATVDRRR